MTTTAGEPRQLQGKLALVTGATGGLGRACTRAFTHAGTQLVLVARDHEKLRNLQCDIGTDHRNDTLLIAGDIGDPSFAGDCFAQIQDELGRPVDILVNNAGTIVRATAEDTTDDDWHRIMNTNLHGLFYFSRAFAQQDHTGGVIINVSSTCGTVGSAGLAAYCASKGAVNQLTRAMALELADRGINVNAVAPGAIDSPMLHTGHATTALAESVITRNESIIPIGAVAQPEEVARAILFLASEPHVTGTILPIDGGYTTA